MNTLPLEIPKSAPVMVLPAALLMPMSLLPLYIFEEQYRQMLAYALERERMFCIAMLKPGLSSALTADDFYRVAGIGLVRACVKLPDGTSNLILQGLERVRILGWEQEKPFRIARLQALSSAEGQSVEAEALAERLLELCFQLKSKGLQMPVPIEKRMEAMMDPSTLGDIVSHSFVRDPFTRQELLEERSVPLRLRRLVHLLQEEVRGSGS